MHPGTTSRTPASATPPGSNPRGPHPATPVVAWTAVCALAAALFLVASTAATVMVGAAHGADLPDYSTLTFRLIPSGVVALACLPMWLAARKRPHRMGGVCAAVAAVVSGSAALVITIGLAQTTPSSFDTYATLRLAGGLLAAFAHTIPVSLNLWFRRC